MFATSVVVPVNGTIHSPLRRHFRPVSTVLPRYFTVTPILVNSTSHPALHSTGTDTSECVLRPGMTCPILACFGSRGMSRRPTWVELTLFPSGNVTVSGPCASIRSLRGVSVTRKFPVAPESNTAHFLMSLTLKSIVTNDFPAA